MRGGVEHVTKLYKKSTAQERAETPTKQVGF